MSKVHKLPQELINQIAAGEVIERPSSVVKELIDNSIDAGSSEIKVIVKDGGLSEIEISDNGKGIDKEDLSLIFEPHTTSKLSTLEELSNILTLGFRGEALSTIKAVSDVSISSNSSKGGYSIDFSAQSKVGKSARDQGTTITIKRLFYNTPARLKFMKSAETEYRKILEVFIKYSLAYPQIRFVLKKDNRDIFTLPINQNVKERASLILKKDFIERMISINLEGVGFKISGLVAHPSDCSEKVKEQYLFINKRPIWDSGAAKSIYSGYARYIPHNYRVPFILNIEIDPRQIDVNVHPRKEEVKFTNPFRIYSTIEEGISRELSNILTKENITSSPQSFKAFDRSTISYSKSSGNIKQIRFDKHPSDFSIRKSMEFSKEVLSSKPENGSIKTTFQIFNKYIIVEFEKEVWIIDQHAAAERITFEKLLLNLESKSPDIQNLLVPDEIDVNEIERSYISENIDFFKKLGFILNLKKKSIEISGIPAQLNALSVKEIIRSIFDIPEDERDIKKDFEKAKEDILATIACHNSVRSGQRLGYEECRDIYSRLLKCKNPFSCPHGRPAIWKLGIEEVDSHFLRTY